MDKNNIPFVLPKPLPYFNIYAVAGGWHCFFLDNTTAKVAWVITDKDGTDLSSGNWIVPQDVFDNWGTNNDVVTEALVAAQPWLIQE